MNVYDYIVDNAILTNLEGKTKREVVAELLADMKEAGRLAPVYYTHLRAHETVLDIVFRLLLATKNHHQQHTTH